MSTADSPPAEVEIDATLVRSLVAQQHPSLADLDVRFLAEGWDNAMFRLGPSHLVRLPRRELAVRLMEHEQRWLPELADRLPLPIPAPTHVGEPSELFGWPWSIVRWMDGSDAISSPLVNTVEAGDTLGSFFAALHQPAPDDSPVNRFRGVPLRQRAEQLDGLLSTFVADGLVPPETRGVWDAGLEADPYGGPPLWLHGDPHSGNLLVHNDAIVSVIDWGDITSGDPASDLTCMWIALDPAGRRAARRRLGYDDDVWTRGRAWATAIGVMLLGHSDDRPEYFALGHRTIEQVLLD